MRRSKEAGAVPPARLPEPSGKLQRRQRTLDVINFKLLEVQTEKTQFEQKLKNKFKNPKHFQIYQRGETSISEEENKKS